VAPPPTRFAPAPVQRQAAVSRPATQGTPPPTRFAPAPVQRQGARSIFAVSAAAPRTRNGLSADRTIQPACFGCFGSKQHQTPLPTQQGQALRDRLADTVIAEGKASRLKNRTQDKKHLFVPSTITSCTMVYYRKGDYCAVAHIKGVQYDDSLINELHKMCNAQTNELDDEDLKVYFSVGERDTPFAEIDQKNHDDIEALFPKFRSLYQRIRILPV
jgi:hypothetical protein